MIRNEVGKDDAAPAMENTAAEGSLYNQLTDALSDPKTLAILGGTALATAAAVKFGRPLLALGKAATPVGDDALLASIREAASGARHGETTILGVAKGSHIAPATDALLKSSIPIGSNAKGPATEALLKNGIPIDRSSLKDGSPLKSMITSDLRARLASLSEAMRGAKPFGVRDTVPPRFEPHLALDHAEYHALAGRLAPPIKSIDVASAIEQFAKVPKA